MPTRRQSLCALLCPAAPLALAQDDSLVIVVGAPCPLQALTRSQAVAYFTGRLRTLPGGEPAQPLDLPLDHPARERFYRLLTGLGLAQMNSYWSRLAFSGQMQPPQVVAGEAELVRLLRASPRALGYLPRPPDDERLRTLLVVKPEA